MNERKSRPALWKQGARAAWADEEAANPPERRFDLRKIVDRVLDESDEASPLDLAEEVRAQIGAFDLEGALRAALPTYIEARAYERRGEPAPASTEDTAIKSTKKAKKR